MSSRYRSSAFIGLLSRGLMPAAVAVALSACATMAPRSCVAGTQPMTKLELFFGGNIGAAEWRGFLADVVTPRFPDGFSVTDVQGQYRGATGMIIAEQSRELMVI